MDRREVAFAGSEPHVVRDGDYSHAANWIGKETAIDLVAIASHSLH